MIIFTFEDMIFSTKRIFISLTVIVLLVSSVLAGIHPFTNQQKNHNTQNTSLILVKKDSSVVKKTTTTTPAKEIKKETPSSKSFKDFINFDADEEKKENNNSFSLFPLLKQGLKVILNQMTK
ncbi:hypothetical protein [Pedobacter glucosidilyticus]|uniref:hypothetical protein n=1 Tax=Pedobacter glucosidilyticus TaxID=1122941 RepID=UPI0003F80D3B|nr:hypothetical protein [Pedobacter glucosidilyticus]